MQQRVEIREQLFQKGLGSKINYLTELQDLVTQRQELTVQDSRHSEAEAAIAVLVEMRTKAVAEYERSLFEELAKAEQKVAGLTQDVIKAERRTALQTLTAPIDGTVQQLAVHTVGGVATPAQTLMLIVPEDSRLEIEANISNRDIGFVEPGQDVAIKVDTFNFTRYGLLSGKISEYLEGCHHPQQAACPRRRFFTCYRHCQQRTSRSGARIFRTHLGGSQTDGCRK